MAKSARTKVTVTSAGPTATLEVATSLIDAELLDVLAQIEALLRSGRELQQELLRLRGVALPSTRRGGPRARTMLEELVGSMEADNRQLSRVLRALRAAIRRETHVLNSRQR